MTDHIATEKPCVECAEMLLEDEQFIVIWTGRKDLPSWVFCNPDCMNSYWEDRDMKDRKCLNCKQECPPKRIFTLRYTGLSDRTPTWHFFCCYECIYEYWQDAPTLSK